ncbi:hypothetical protein [Nonomuraea dietziae]|uniref:hypothetical protein n=1 Tax=Nonomuraea dietziae TaxID=65515 RepID=UPI0031DB9E7C
MALTGRAGIIGMAVACGLLAAGLTGCGVQGAVSDAEARRQSLELKALLSQERLLPDGFSGPAREAWQSPLAKASSDCRAVLDAATGHPPLRALEGNAAVSFQGDVLGELAAVGMAVYAGGEAEEHLEDMGRAMDGCPVLRGGRSHGGNAAQALRAHAARAGGRGGEQAAARTAARLSLRARPRAGPPGRQAALAGAHGSRHGRRQAHGGARQGLRRHGSLTLGRDSRSRRLQDHYAGTRGQGP